MMMVSKEKANGILELYKDNTAYFGNTFNEEPLDFDDMYEMFREMGFGIAEAKTILASLVLVGAKFKENQ